MKYCLPVSWSNSTSETEVLKVRRKKKKKRKIARREGTKGEKKKLAILSVPLVS